MNQVSLRCAVDYVYEPGQFAVRGSILDVYSYSCEYPYRIDFFGDDIDSIRTFEVEDQLSKDQRTHVEIVPELVTTGDKVPFLSFLPKETLLVTKDYFYVRDAIDRTYQEGFSAQAKAEQMSGATEMEQHEIELQLRKELQLITGAQFMEAANTFRRIEFGHRPSASDFIRPAHQVLRGLSVAGVSDLYPRRQSETERTPEGYLCRNG